MVVAYKTKDTSSHLSIPSFGLGEDIIRVTIETVQAFNSLFWA